MKRFALFAAGMFAAGLSPAAMDVDALWNFDDPAASEARFREALVNAKGDDAPILRAQIARWHVANVPRLEGQRDEAMAMQLALERDAAAAGEPGSHVYDELALLYAAAGGAARATSARAKAEELRRGR